METKLKEDVREASQNVSQMSEHELSALFERIIEHLEFEQYLLESVESSRTEYSKIKSVLQLIQGELAKQKRIQNVRRLAPVIDKALAYG